MTRGSLQRLTLADGTSIAYRVIGSGGPTVVLCNGVTTTHDFWEGSLDRWQDRRIVLWDYPGHGASSPARSRASTQLPALADITVALLDALDTERASLVGFSMGSQVAIAAGLQAPSRVDAVASILGPAGGLFDTALRGVGGKVAAALLNGLPGASVHLLHGALKLGIRTPFTYAAGRALGLYGPETSRADIRGVTDHLASIHAPTVREILLSAGGLDFRPELASLQPPLLIIAGERDTFAPAKTVGRPMKAWAPNAELVVLCEGTHGSLFGHGSIIVDRIETFFAQHAI